MDARQVITFGMSVAGCIVNKGYVFIN